jgi:hypothetical protein
MADRFNKTAFDTAITGSGLLGASAVRVEMQETDGDPFKSLGDPYFAQTPSFFSSGSAGTLPEDDTLLGDKTASGGTSFDKLQYRIDYGSGFTRLFRIDNIGEGGIVTGETVTVRTGSLDAGQEGMANVLRQGLSNLTVDVNVIDNQGVQQQQFTDVSFVYNSPIFSLDETLSFQNNTGSDFTIDFLVAKVGGNNWFAAPRNDDVVDGAQVEITGLTNELTNLPV